LSLHPPSARRGVNQREQKNRHLQKDKSFLVLFFKKELLASFDYRNGITNLDYACIMLQRSKEAVLF
jgi:hypothetical protein